MAVPFDPFSFEILPPIRPDTPKANLFVAGMLLNRISYHFVETALFAKNQFLDATPDFASVIDPKLTFLAAKIHQLRRYDPRLANRMDPFFKGHVSLQARCEELKREQAKSRALPEGAKRPRPQDYVWRAGSGYPLSTSGEGVSRHCRFLIEVLSEDAFKAGYLVDRYTHGTGNYTGEEDYFYSHLPILQEGSSGNVEIVWRQFEDDCPCDWDTHVSEDDKGFLKRFYFDGKTQTVPFLDSGKSSPLPSPTEWANAVTGMWDALVRWDKPSAGFERLSVSSGDISLDGVVVVSFPPGGQLYQALKYMVDRLKDDPLATFSNEEIKAIVGSDDDSFSISKLVAPSKAGKNHRKLAEIIRPKVVVGDDGRDTVTLEKPPELEAFWQSADPEIDCVLRPSQRKSS